MKKKTGTALTIALSLVSALAIFAGCKKHKHSWEDWRSYDNTYHIHGCTGCDETEKEQHTYQDGACIDCGHEKPQEQPPATDYVNVTFKVGNLSKVVEVKKGEKVSADAADFSEYYVLTSDWKTESGQVFDFSAAVNEAITLTADCYSVGFTVNNSGALTAYSGKSTYVIVPEELNGTTVTELSTYLFFNAKNANAITHIILPETLTTIGSLACGGLDSAEYIYIPAGITSINSRAFESCPKLLIDFAGNTTYPKDEYGIVFTSSAKTDVFFYAGEKGGDVTISANIPRRALYGAQIGKLTITSAVPEIGNEAFARSAVKEVVWQSALSVPQQAFESCGELTKVALEGAITAIGMNAFKGCSKLSEVKLPASLNSLGSGCFANCIALEEIDLTHTGVSSITGKEFEGAGLKSFTMPDGITEITDGMFTNWVGLTTFGFNDVTVIGANAFQGCRSLLEIVIPNTVTEIKNGAFNGCSSLERVTFAAGSTLKILGNDFSLVSNNAASASSGVFGGTRITELVIPDSVEVIGIGALMGMSRLEKLSIPFVGTYSFSRWKTELQQFMGLDSAILEQNPNLTSAYKAIMSSTGSYDIQFFGSSKGSFSQLQLFGAVFGTTQYTGGVECAQYSMMAYDIGSRSHTYKYYVPSTLEIVTITHDTLIPAYSFNFVTTDFRLGEESTTEVIGDYAFYYCLNYTEYKFSNNVKQIGNYAFDSVGNGLRTVNPPTRLELPDSVFFIGAYAFRNNVGLTEIKLPDNAKLTVSPAAFFNDQYRAGVVENNKLYTVYQNPANRKEGYLTIEKGQLSNSVFYQARFTHAVLGDAVTFLTVNMGLEETAFDYRAGVFSGCAWLVDVKMTSDLAGKVSRGGEWVAELPGSFFAGCTSLARLNSTTNGEFNLPKCNSVGNYAFSGVGLMRTVNLPQECTKLGEFAFQETGIVEVDIRYITDIGSSVFHRCRSLREVTWGSALTTFQTGVYGLFEGCTVLNTFNAYDAATGTLTEAEIGECLIPEGFTTLPRYGFKTTAISSVKLPSTLKALPMQAFYECTNIQTITIPAGVTSLGSQSFYGCTALKEVIFENPKITTLPGSAFENCTSLEKVVIPNGVEIIENYAFRGCTSLTTVVIPSSVRDLGAGTFMNCPNLKALYLLSAYPPELDAGIGPNYLFWSTELRGSALETLMQNGFRIYIPRDAEAAYSHHNASYSNNSTRTYGWKNYAAAFAFIDTGYYVDANGNSLTVSLNGDGELSAKLSGDDGVAALVFDNDSYSFTLNGTDYTVEFTADGATVKGGNATLELFRLSGAYYDKNAVSAADQFEALASKIKNITEDERAGVDTLKEALTDDIHFLNNLVLTADGKVYINLYRALRTQFSRAPGNIIMGYMFAATTVKGSYTVENGVVTIKFEALEVHAGTYDASLWSDKSSNSWTYGETDTVTVTLADLQAGTATIALPALPIWNGNLNTPATLAAADYTFSRTLEA